MRRVAPLVELALAALATMALAQTAPADAPATAGVTSPGAVDLLARDTYRFETVVCPFKGEIRYEPGEIECGLLQVPENREKAGSRFIELHVVKVNSTWGEEKKRPEPDGDARQPAPGRREDPVVYLTGGPGARVGYYVKRLKDHGILEHRDLYILEQRGIGFSDDFCPEYHLRKPEASNVGTLEEHLAAKLSAAADCAANAAAQGVDLGGYNTFENARDVKALRRALGLEQWNVWGISYGSILGQAYLKVDPEGVRAVVLDAIVPLDVRGNPWAWRTVHWYLRDLEKLDELCRAQPDCGRRYPDLVGRLERATTSVADNPVVVEVKDVETYPTGKASIFTDVVAFLPFVLFYEQSEYPGLPGLIHAWADAVERRDEAVFKAIAMASGDWVDSSQGMANAILCSDGDADAQVVAGRADIAEHPVFGAAIGSVAHYEQSAALCREHGIAPRDPAEYAPVSTDIPALLIAGDMDPITPPPLAQAVLPGFSRGTYVEFPYAGHGPSRSVTCAGNLLNLFFDEPSAAPDLSCVETMEAPRFFVPVYETTFGPRLVVLALEDWKKLVAPGVWGAASILVSVGAFLVLSVAPLGRRVDRRTAAPTRGARPCAWLAAFLATLAVAVLGAAMGVTFKTSKVLLLFGLVPWARYGAIAGLLAGLLGLATVVLTLLAHRRLRLPVGTLLGLLLTGVATVSLSAFLLVWGLGPF